MGASPQTPAAVGRTVPTPCHLVPRPAARRGARVPPGRRLQCKRVARSLRRRISARPSSVRRKGCIHALRTVLRSVLWPPLSDLDLPVFAVFPMITDRAGHRQPLTPRSQLFQPCCFRPQQSPPPRSQGLNLTRRRRREPANQPPRITTVCGGRVGCSAVWQSGKWRQTQLELGCACLPALEGSARC